jgi:hypothetical protein
VRVQIWDALVFYTPEFSLVADHARAGKLLLWDPWLAAGTPDFADPQVGAASPIGILMGAIGGGTSSSFRAYWLLVWFLGPLGLLLLARHLGISFWGAFIVALGYAFSGVYTAHAEFVTVVYSFSFLPFAIWRLDHALSYRRFTSAAQAGAFWGVSALGGYPAIVILSGGMLFLWALGRCCCQNSGESLPFVQGPSKEKYVFSSFALVVVFCVGVVVLAPTYVAFFTQALGYSERAGAVSRNGAIGAMYNSLNPGALATFATPYLTSLKFPLRNPGLWPGSDISVANVYMGVLPFVLALFALVIRPKSAWRWWLLGIVAFFLACAVGDRLPVRGWVYDLVPPTRYFTHSGMFRGYALFSAAILALLGANDLDQAKLHERQHIWKIFVVIAIFASTAAFLAYFHVISHVANLGPQFHRANRHMFRVWVGVALSSILFWLVPKTRTWLAIVLVGLGLMDAMFTARLSEEYMSDPWYSRTILKSMDDGHKQTLLLHDLRRERAGPYLLGGEHSNSAAPLRTPTFYNDATLKNRFQTDFKAHPVLLNMALGEKRIWFSKDAVIAPPSNAVYWALVKRSEEMGSPVLVIHPHSQMYEVSSSRLSTPSDPAQQLAISRLSTAENVPIQLVRYTPNHLEMKVSCPADGWLLVTDRWASGWRAKVNGEATEVFGGNLIFRAVRVKAGQNYVRFDYDQPLYFVLLVLSWGTLFSILIAAPLRVALLGLMKVGRGSSHPGSASKAGI